jgi:hypothetical protein
MRGAGFTHAPLDWQVIASVSVIELTLLDAAHEGLPLGAGEAQRSD